MSAHTIISHNLCCTTTVSQVVGHGRIFMDPLKFHYGHTLLSMRVESVNAFQLEWSKWQQTLHSH